MHAHILDDLLNFRYELPQLVAALSDQAWDSDIPLVFLTRAHVGQVLARYLKDELSASQLEDWANAVEGRDDIGFEEGYGDELMDIIFQLANPLLTVLLTPASATTLMQIL